MLAGRGRHRYVHLCNRCVQKFSDNYEKTDIDGNMWASSTFREYLQYVHKKSPCTWQIMTQTELARLTERVGVG